MIRSAILEYKLTSLVQVSDIVSLKRVDPVYVEAKLGRLWSIRSSAKTSRNLGYLRQKRCQLNGKL